MEASYKCPHCGKQTFGTNPGRFPTSTVHCPSCQKEGLTVVMHEQKDIAIDNMGGGLFQKRNKIN